MVTISVVMPTYNTNVSVLREAVDSILAQTFRDFEFLIIDDGSTNESVAYLNTLADPRIRIIRNETNIGVTKSLNIGFREARGKYIARMDSDDISVPERFEKQLAFMESHPDVIVCGAFTKDFTDKPSADQRVGVKKGIEDMESYRVRMLFVNPGPTHPTAFFNREMLIRHNIYYDEELVYAQDYGMWMTVSRYGRVCILPEVLLFRRMSDNRISNVHREKQIECDKATQRKLLTELLGTVTEEELTLHNFYSTLLPPEATMNPQISKWYGRLIAANKHRRIYNQKLLKQRIIFLKKSLVYNAFTKVMPVTKKVFLPFYYLPFTTVVRGVFMLFMRKVKMDKAFSFIRHQFARVIRILHIMNLFVKGTVLSYFKNDKNAKEDYPIDIVITWVDGNDEKWIREKTKYYEMTDTQITKQANLPARYRNWDLLPYWFRAIEKYAPWVRTVFFVTCGHKPDWLNIENSKLRFISHSDFIPPQYLPTFCSDTIELNLWRIKDLSEHFIYFNDDVFLNKPVKPEDFFTNGLPKLTAIAKPAYFSETIPSWAKRFLNDYVVINEAFNITEAIEKNPEKWFSHIIGIWAIYSIWTVYIKRILEDGYIVGMKSSHCVMPFLKDSFRQLWHEYYEILNKSCCTKFRTVQDVTIRLPTLWSIFTGNFCPAPNNYYGPSIELSLTTINRVIAVIQQSKYIGVCLNDGDNTRAEDVPELRSKLIETFTRKFPDKSSFER